MNSFGWLVVNGRRLPIRDTEIPVLDGGQPTTHRIAIPRDTKTLLPGASAIVGHTGSISLLAASRQWRSPNKQGTYQGIGMIAGYQNFLMQDWNHHNNTQVAQVPVGESLFEFARVAQINAIPGMGVEIDRNFSRVLQPLTHIRKHKFAPGWTAPKNSEQFKRFEFVLPEGAPHDPIHAECILFDDPPAGFGVPIPRRGPS